MEDILHQHVSHGSLGRHHDSELAQRADAGCEPADPANTVTDRLNNLLKNSGDGYVLRLCPKQVYHIQAPILFAHPNQEVSTLGYPTGDDRAVLSVSGPVANGEGHTTAIDGSCGSCDGIKIRNIQIDGTRRGASPTKGGGNIEIGGDNQNQLVEYVRSFDPRGWSCLHIAEGPLSCKNVTIQNNDVGPCGSDKFQEWADGVSMSCRDSIVRNNMIQGATDGGIVIFGAPGTQVFNNTIWVLNQTLLGGINLVDYDPFNGDFTGTIVRDNVILGGFATDAPDNNTKGNNFENAIIKIGIALGPRTWFGDRYQGGVSRNGVIRNNRLSGAFTYGIAVTSADNFMVQDNVMFGNTSFIGGRGPLCKDTDVVPNPAPFIVDPRTTKSTTLQSDFQTINDGDSLTCVLPPNGGDFWPFGLNPSNSTSAASTSSTGKNSGDSGSVPGATSATSSNTTGVAIGVVVGVLACGVVAWIIRKWAISRREKTKLYNATKQSDYTQKMF